MPEIKKLLKLPKIEYLKTHLSIVNCIIPKDTRMTPSEIKILATFMDMGSGTGKYRFGTTSRKVVMDKLGISISNLSNYFKSLQDKGILVKRENILTIHPILIPQDNEQHYKFILVVKEEKKEENKQEIPIEITTTTTTIPVPTLTTETNNNDNNMDIEIKLTPRDNAIINLGWAKFKDNTYVKKNYKLSFEPDNNDLIILKDSNVVFAGECTGMEDLKAILSLLRIQ